MKKYIVSLIAILLLVINIAGCSSGKDENMPQEDQGAVDNIYEPEKEINNINVEEKNADIIIKTTEGNLKVIAMDRDNHSDYEFQEVGDTLNILKTMSIKTNQNRQKLIIQMPKKKYGDIKAQTDNGNLSVEDVDLKHLEVNLGNGDANIKNSKIANIGIECKKGSINIDDTVSSSYNMETEIGNITVGVMGSPDEFQIEGKTEVGENSLADIKGNPNAQNNILAITKNGDINISFTK